MKGKAHLIDSEEPLISVQTFRAKCGQEIRNAVLVFMWDVKELGHPQVSAFHVCRICWFSKYIQRYLSGIVSGEIAKQMENQEQV